MESLAKVVGAISEDMWEDGPVELLQVVSVWVYPSKGKKWA